MFQQIPANALSATVDMSCIVLEIPISGWGRGLYFDVFDNSSMTLKRDRDILSCSLTMVSSSPEDQIIHLMRFCYD